MEPGQRMVTQSDALRYAVLEALSGGNPVPVIRECCPQLLPRVEQIVSAVRSGDIERLRDVASLIPQPLRDVVECLATLCPEQRMLELARRLPASAREKVLKLYAALLVRRAGRLPRFVVEREEARLREAARAIASKVAALAREELVRHPDKLLELPEFRKVRELLESYKKLVESVRGYSSPAALLSLARRVEETYRRLMEEAKRLGLGLEVPNAAGKIVESAIAMGLSMVASGRMSIDELARLIESNSDIVSRYAPWARQLVAAVREPSIDELYCLVGGRPPAPGARPVAAAPSRPAVAAYAV